MSRKIKRFLGVAFILVMAFVVMTTGAFAAEETNVAKIGDTEYATLANAISAADAGNTITLLNNVNENVTISKKLTIDGAGNQYTGKMTISNNKNVIIQDVEFVKGYINEEAGAHGYLTVKDCSFDGVDKSIGYAITHRGGDALVIENTTAKNYSTGMLYVPSAVTTITVADVEVSNVVAAFNISYSGDATFENVKFNNVTYGIHFQIYGSRTYTVKNSDLSGATNPFWFWDKSSNTHKVTVLFEGENTVPVFQNPIPAGALKLAEGATLTAPEGLDVITDVEDSYVAYNNGVYTVVENAKAAEVNGKEYKTLAEAIKAATKGDTITLLSDVKESVTINKNLTIDGAGNDYTGKMTANKGLTVTVQNVNFVNGGFDKSKANKSTTGSYTIKDCTFDGEGEYAYPLRFYGANSIAVENCTVKDYLYSFLYVPSAAMNVTVKNVTVENCPNYAVYFASGVTNAKFENLTVKNSNNGFVINNTAIRKLTIKDCKMENVNTAINHSNGTYSITCKVLGENDFGDAAFSQYVKLEAAAQIGTKFYGSLKAAVDAANDGDTVTVVADTTLSNTEDISAKVSGMYPYISVIDKEITIDLNGKKITANPSLDSRMLAIFYAGDNGKLTLKDSSEAQTGTVDVTMAEGTEAYSMFSALGSSKMYIESGNYSIDKVEYGQSMLYAGQDKQMFVSGGNFYLGNAGTKDPGNGAMQPWMYNAHGDGIKVVVVTGGTYNVDPTHYHGEAHYPYCYKVVKNEDATYSVVYAPAVVIGDEGYESLTDAVNAAKEGDIITVIEDHELENSDAEIAAYDMYAYMTVSDKKITIDLNGKTITANPSFDKSFYGVIVVNGTGDVTLTDSSADKTGAINVTAVEGTEIYSMLSTDGNKSKLTIEDGNYYIDKVDKGYSMIYIAQTGTGYVSGGNFVLGNAKTIEREGGVMAPWIFNTAGNGVNFVEVTGGTYNTDPTHHWGEAKFKRGYVTVQAEDGMWKLVRGPVIVEQPTDITIGYNKMAHFAPEIKGDGLTYKWYYKDANTSWNTSTLTTSTYDIKGIASRDGRQVYCVATDCTGKSVRTEIATLHVVPNEELTIVKQPKVVEGELNKNVSVALDVEGDGLTYVWYYSDNGGKSYYKSSLTTATYDIILKEERMGRKVYCIITDAFGDTVKSDVITINAVQSIELKVLSAPVYQAVAVGKTAKITLDVQGEGLKYTWYYSLPGKTTFYKSSIADSEYKITLSADRVGRNVYCVITDAFGNSVQTETITLYAQ